MVGELKWWFPTSLAVVGGATACLLFLVNSYYESYYKVFGLTLDDVGISRSDELLHFITLGVILATVLLLARLVNVGINASARNQKPLVPRLNRQHVGVATVFLAAVCIFGVIWINNYMSEAGTSDATTAATTADTRLYAGSWQESFGLRYGGVAYLQWVGPPELSILKNEDGSSKESTLVRILAQRDETTIYFDLMDCAVHRVPTIYLSISYGLVHTGTGQPESYNTEPCTV